MLKTQENAKKPDKEGHIIYSTYVTKEIFFCKRARPDIDQAVQLLSSGVKDNNEGHGKKLLRFMSSLKGAIKDVLMSEDDDTNNLTWYIDVELSVHADMKSHTGAVFTMRKGAIISSYTKEKVNA